MVTFDTTAASPAWQPHGDADYAAIGVATVFAVTAALLTANVIWKASWPPYTAAMPQMIVYGAVGAMAATLGVSLRYGMWGAEGQEPGCTTVACLIWLGLGSLFSNAFLRVYHYHEVLVGKKITMWPIALQQLVLLLPFTLPPAFLASPNVAGFNPTSMECQSTSAVPETFAFGAMGILATLSVAPYEFEAAMIASVPLLIAAIAFPWVHVKMEGGRAARRVIMLFLTTLTAVAVVGAPVLRLLTSYITNDEKLRNSGEFCFGEWRSDERTQYLRRLQRRFQKAVNSPAGHGVQGYGVIVAFFRDIAIREEITSYPLVQASTMRILDTYFKDGVPSAVAVPMSEACRKSTLTFRASSAFIFDRARDEMLERMGLQKIPRPEEVGSPALTVKTHSTSTSGVSSIGVLLSPRDGTIGVSSVPSPIPRESAEGDRRRSAEVRAENAPDTPLTPPLGYRGAGRKTKKEKEEKAGAEAGADGDEEGGRVGVRRKKNPILALFGKLGGGKSGVAVGGRSRDQDGSSNDCAPSVVHMADDEGFDDTEEGSAEKGRRASRGGRARGGSGKTQVGNLAGVADLHSAFGLAKANDEDEDEDEDEGISQKRFVGGKKKKGHPRGRRPSVGAVAGIGGYGSVLSSASSGSGGADLAEAARAIPHPLFGDLSRSVGRRGSATNPARASGDVVTVTGATSTVPGILKNGDKKRIVGGENQDLAEAYGLDRQGDGGGGKKEPEDSPLVDAETVNPLFKNGGGSRVRSMARAFDAEAQAQAVSAGLAVDNNKIGPASRAGRMKQSGRKGNSKERGGGGGGGGKGEGGRGGGGENEDNDQNV